VLLIAGQASGYSSGSPGDGGSSSRNQRYASGEILVTYKDGASPARRAKVEKALGNPRAVERLVAKANSAVYLYKLAPGLSVERAVGKLKGDNGIIAEPNYLFSLTFIPDDPDFSPNQWGLRNTGQLVGGVAGTPGADISAVEAWDIERGLTNQVTVAVIDSGIDLAHPDLQGRIWQNPGEIPNNGLDDDGNGYVDDVFGWNFVHNNKTPGDDNGHGTHVSGIAAAATNNGRGIAGVSHGALIMPLKAANSAGGLSVSNVIKAIDYAVDNGADIINMSFAAPLSPPSTALGSAIDQAHAKGLTLLAAVGNEGDGTINYPAGYHNVIGVGATTNRDQKASFSNRNFTVDIVAPGQTIYSTMPTYAVTLNSYPDLLARNYDFVSGTSMATPMAAGVAALAKARNPGAPPTEISRMMAEGADDKGAPGRDDEYGHGRLNALETLRLSVVLDTVRPKASVSVPNISTNVSKTTTFKVSWKASDAAPSSGIASYHIQRRIGPGGSWVNWKKDVTIKSADFEGQPGENYYFRVKAKDQAGNLSDWSPVKRAIVPFDNDSLITARSGFSGTVSSLSSGFYLGTSRYSTKRGDKITYRFTGKRVALISHKSKNRSRARIYINGNYVRTIDARSSTLKPRQVLYAQSWGTSGTRTITIENLGTSGRSRFDVDGLAVGR
jgi:subtilisin family serine protease